MAEKASVKPAAKPSAPAAGRPLGVTVICILVLIGAILSILGGVALVGLGGLMGAVGLGIFGAMGAVLGVVTLLIGIVSLVAFWWLWKMLKKGWTLAIILEVIGLILNLVSFNMGSVVGIVLALVIIVYLWMKKDLFV